MKFRQVRNATVLIEYAGTRFLVDPMLASKGTYPGLEGTVNGHLKWPTVELPIAMDAILDVDAVIVTHTHPDHWDETAKSVVPKSLPVFVQHERDARLVKASGFMDVRLLTHRTQYNGVTLVKTPGQHGTDDAIHAIGELLGEVCGVVFRHADEKTLYLAGDTVWNKHVEQNLKRFRPDVVIVNSGDAQVVGLGAIIMGKEDVYEVHRAAPQATLIASHMEAVNHAALTRQALREFSKEKGMTDRLLVPEDGQAYVF
ncbi:MBL fold metallo-hydrolase [Burkholderia sp. ABCPW 111]|uniref:MBL fold metallo-hydrolase n=1 Tax=Burkholderia sp. ABCPW 111 TaxID=1820025 RepID=UPI000531EC11|nr:MBL fold metallo-hydrolase [Burkholderia sp. ABCPW 111]KGS04936.1 beta-lactamase superfamily domain protein [Burkholderia sp. ABCPW 111]